MQICSPWDQLVMQQWSFEILIFDHYNNANSHKYWAPVDPTTQGKLHLSNIIQAVDSASEDAYYAKKLAHVEAQAKAIFEEVQMQLVKAHLMRKDIKDAQERGTKRKREEFEEESDEEPPHKRCCFIDEDSEEAESDEELESAWETNTLFILSWNSPLRRWSLGPLSVDE